jgi:hypothetical protein
VSWWQKRQRVPPGRHADISPLAKRMGRASAQRKRQRTHESNTPGYSRERVSQRHRTCAWRCRRAAWASSLDTSGHAEQVPVPRCPCWPSPAGTAASGVRQYAPLRAQHAGAIHRPDRHPRVPWPGASRGRGLATAGTCLAGAASLHLDRPAPDSACRVGYRVGHLALHCGTRPPRGRSIGCALLSTRPLPRASPRARSRSRHAWICVRSSRPIRLAG